MFKQGISYLSGQVVKPNSGGQSVSTAAVVGGVVGGLVGAVVIIIVVVKFTTSGGAATPSAGSSGAPVSATTEAPLQASRNNYHTHDRWPYLLTKKSFKWHGADDPFRYWDREFVWSTDRGDSSI